MADSPAVHTESASEFLPGRPADEAPDTAVLVEDLLVEEVSIDGMCGVY
jgi:mycofactocin precursor